jgi:YihY family inner membrane protein
MPKWLQQLIAEVDRFQADRPWLAVPVATVKKFGDDRAGSLAALIAYYGFFSLFPLLVVLVTIVGFVLSGHEGLQHDILNSAVAQFPVIGDQLRRNTGRLDTNGLALVVGSVVALWAGTGVVKAAQDAMNDVWAVPRQKRPNLLKATARSFVMFAVLGGGLVLTTALTGAIGTNLVPRPVGVVLGAALNIAIVLGAFRVLTIPAVGLRTLLPGAILAGLAWLGLQFGGGYLLDNQVSKASETYGTFAVVIGLLWWMHLQAQILLYAAELNVVLARRLWPRHLSENESAPDGAGAPSGADQARVG